MSSFRAYFRIILSHPSVFHASLLTKPLLPERKASAAEEEEKLRAEEIELPDAYAPRNPYQPDGEAQIKNRTISYQLGAEARLSHLRPPSTSSRIHRPYIPKGEE
ncbi:hypothetical protein KM043_015350 [Ampulex compressa]|nr:hypothetical protein KM043_015350 [Ampulex compressa]